MGRGFNQDGAQTKHQRPLACHHQVTAQNRTGERAKRTLIPGVLPREGSGSWSKPWVTLTTGRGGPAQTSYSARLNADKKNTDGCVHRRHCGLIRRRAVLVCLPSTAVLAGGRSFDSL
ncbi:unnamed protein product [Boreogadus saida]